MAKRYIKFRADHFKKIRLLLKETGNNKLYREMMGSAFLEDESSNIVTKTKKIILYIAGDFTSDPGELQNEIDFKDELNYQDDEYSILQMRLNKLVKEYNDDESIDEDETNECDTVGDCVKLVQSKVE